MNDKNWTRLLWLMTGALAVLGAFGCAPDPDGPWGQGIGESTNGGVGTMAVGTSGVWPVTPVDMTTGANTPEIPVGSDSNSSIGLTGSISTEQTPDTATKTIQTPDVDTPTASTPDVDSQSVDTTTECTDEMMGDMVGCLTLANYMHFRGADPSCGCGTDWCSWDTCTSGCMTDYAAAVADCYESHSLCGQAYYASWQFCSVGCTDDYNSCAAAINCLDVSGDVSRCRQQQMACQRSC